MKIATVNVNGIRAAVKHRSETNLGFHQWLNADAPDVVLLQEVRADEAQTRAALAPALDEGWHYAGAPAAAKGRAGVGILSRFPLLDVQVGIDGFEDAGRFIAATVGGDCPAQGLRVASLYLPSGSAGTEKQDEKYAFLDSFGPTLSALADQYPLMVIGGDWNICHRREDLKNDKANMKKSGFLADERAFMDSVFGTFPEDAPQISAGEFLGAVDYQPTAAARARTVAQDPQWFDVARRLQPEGDGPYTWWTYRGQAFDTNAGWRIDYQAVTKDLLDRATSARVAKADAYDLRWSDHSPLVVTYDF
ncbi:exodeoxyribonuclease III [Corynebacterium aquilae]|uniref:Exodeoxyribonuclease III n=1 Tax=Corynebacterium aquilae DSM 44791 TaxID=1431546 RepID=A0A1L7CE28_9CORY|nr:exodeoxyribonuclease III [Corynebacterium aquilae]APT84130.1 exodeoxyribonuclease III [Corynebacterium aquilae DSM 44791]